MKRLLATVVLVAVTLSAMPCELLEALSEDETTIVETRSRCVHQAQSPTDRLPDTECSGCLCCTAVSCLSTALSTVDPTPVRRLPRVDAVPDRHPDGHLDGVFHPPRSLA